MFNFLNFFAKTGYVSALQSAGATVLCYKEFPGQWWAKVTHNRTTFWVHGALGNDSMSDPFMNEFPDGKPKTFDLETFGKEYLLAPLSKKETIEYIINQSLSEFDSQNILSYLAKHSI